MYLPEDEGRVFTALPGLRAVKRRYRLREQGRTFCVDVWEHPVSARGVIVAEVEAPTLDELAAITRPAWALREVTDDPRYGAARLAEGEAAPT